MKKTKLDLSLALPGEAHACAACVDRLLGYLRGRAGIEDAHLEQESAGAPRLCLHYDPSVIHADRIEALVTQAGAGLRPSVRHLSLPVEGLRHERHARLIEGALAQTKGVIHASVAFGTRRLYLEFDPTLTSEAALTGSLEQLSLTAAGPPSAAVPRAPQVAPKAHLEEEGHAHEHAHGGPFGQRSELVFSLACGVLAGTGWALGASGLTGESTAVPTGLFILAYVLGGWFTVQEVFVALKARRFEIDFLMLLAAIGAAALGEWFEGALLLFLFTFGHALEGFAMSRARKAITALGKLVPQTALRLDPAGQATEVEVSALALGDRLLVKPNTRVPADGFVLEGTGSVNQAPITGESVPVDKEAVPDPARAAENPVSLDARHRVFAGTINGPSVLKVQVLKVAADSTLARVVQLVEEAETQKSPSQLFTDKFERVFVPVIVAGVVALMFAWLVRDEPFAASFYRAMAVLVAASPCALAIATPSAVLSAVARAARGGVLIKGGAHLEALGSVRAIAFDKTGTLTEGKPKLTDVVPAEGQSEEELLQVALAVEKQSDHPLALAIVEGAASRLSADSREVHASGVEAIIGYGVRANVGETEVLIGKLGLFTQNAPIPVEIEASARRLQAEGRTVMVVKRGARYLGAIGVMDTPRANAREVVSSLRQAGIEHTVMLTGDNQQVADAVASQVGIEIARGDQLPEDKVRAIEELAKKAGGVAMVGDGVNDAPAMANATVGIAMGAGSSDVALETADVALMADDLRGLPFAVGLSRRAKAIIRQNLWASLGMVALLIPATISGVAGIGSAVALHEGSTLLVVLNALRLLAYERS